MIILFVLIYAKMLVDEMYSRLNVFKIFDVETKLWMCEMQTTQIRSITYS